MDVNTLVEDSQTNVRIAAAQVSRRYRGYITYQDLVQEGNYYILTHPRTVEGYLEDGKRGSTRLTNRLARHMNGVARTEKAEASGYRPEDEAFYSRGMLELIIPAIWDDDLMVDPPTPQGDLGGGSSNTDPAERNTWQAMVADVRSAYENADLTQTQRLALSYRYSERLTLAQIARLLELSDSSVAQHIQNGLSRMMRFLGGENPHFICSKNCECGKQSGGPGSRRAISNAAARAATAKEYEE